MLLLLFIVGIAFSSLNRTKSRVYEALLQSDLRTLALAQESYRADSGAFFGGLHESSHNSAIAELELPLSPGVTILIRAEDEGWTARAEHEKLPPTTHHCAVYMGVIEPYVPARREGVIACRLKDESSGGGDRARDLRVFNDAREAG
jgi:hypothetical protein